MILTRITITGADNAVDPRDLIALSDACPFVEWGILRSLNREGTPRYPNGDWIWTLFTAICNAQKMASVQLSLHLCGKLADVAFSGVMPEGWAIWRVQLNGFSKAYRQNLPHRLMHTEWIAQCQTEEALQNACALGDRSTPWDMSALWMPWNVSALWDRSGGSGAVETEWPDPLPGLRMGYAGGIVPGNLVQVIETICAKPGNAEFWLDMESGVRTDDRFDLSKVREVLQVAAPYIGRGR